jgi:hypothetical protein
VPYSRSGLKEMGTAFISTEEPRLSQQNDCNNFNKTTKWLQKGELDLLKHQEN